MFARKVLTASCDLLRRSDSSFNLKAKTKIHEMAIHFQSLLIFWHNLLPATIRFHYVREEINVVTQNCHWSAKEPIKTFAMTRNINRESM